CWGLIALIGMVLTYGLRALHRLVWERGFVVRFLVTWFGPLAALQLSSVAMFIVSIIVFIEGHLWNLGRTPRSSIHPNDH
ncbi:MAG: hypothetical protein ACO391_13445, partial [Pseudomonadales bacterium]